MEPRAATPLPSWAERQSLLADYDIAHSRLRAIALALLPFALLVAAWLGNSKARALQNQTHLCASFLLDLPNSPVPITIPVQMAEIPYLLVLQTGYDSHKFRYLA